MRLASSRHLPLSRVPLSRINTEGSQEPDGDEGVRAHHRTAKNRGHSTCSELSEKSFENYEMLIDLHCHSLYSHDNHLEPEVLIRRAHELGLNGVCFTEHHSVQSSWPVDRLRRPENFLVFRGVEISTDEGHLLVYGIGDDSWNRWGRNNFLRLAKVVESVHALGGICIPAHPFRGWESLGEKIFSFTGFDGIETHNGVNSLSQNLQAVEAALKVGLPSIGGSDCHRSDQVGKAFTEFDNRFDTVEEMIEEIKAGNCRGRLLRTVYPRSRVSK